MVWSPDVCVYHFPCNDGFASALIAKRKWPKIELVPANYGGPVPLVVGRNVLIADFSFMPQTLKNMHARSIVVLDHHKTAKDQLAEFPHMSFSADMMHEAFVSIASRFDMEKSGAVLTWEFAYEGHDVPELIRYIQDRDLWRFKYPDTRAVHLALESIGYDMEEWYHLLINPLIMEDAIEKGRAIEKYYDRQVAAMAETSYERKIDRDLVPVVHVPYAFVSDVCSLLLKKHPSAPYVAAIVNSYGGTTYSLRSEDSRMDVSEVAKKFGGGGHRNAAGFRVP